MEISPIINGNDYSAVVLTVAHDEFKQMGATSLRKLMKDKGVIYDVKGSYNALEVDGQL